MYRVADKNTISKGREELQPGQEIPKGWLPDENLAVLEKQGAIVKVDGKSEKKSETAEKSESKKSEKKSESKDEANEDDFLK